jgi:hemerythrin-like domain-containing protein
MPVVFGAKRESDFTDPVGMLGDCHRRILRFLQVLVTLGKEEMGSVLTDQQRASLAASLHYFRVSARKHTADEEESLFPRLRRLGVAESEALFAKIDALEEDHKWADRCHAEVDRLGQLWLDQWQLSAEYGARFSSLVKQLSDMYQRHIGIEDRELFPFAAAALSAADREAIGAEMAARRGLGRDSMHSQEACASNAQKSKIPVP